MLSRVPAPGDAVELSSLHATYSIDVLDLEKAHVSHAPFGLRGLVIAVQTIDAAHSTLYVCVLHCGRSLKKSWVREGSLRVIDVRLLAFFAAREQEPVCSDGLLLPPLRLDSELSAPEPAHVPEPPLVFRGYRQSTHAVDPGVRGPTMKGQTR